MFLPRDHMTLEMQMEGGLKSLSERITIAHDINELSDAIKTSEDNSHIVVTDLGWDRGYELLIQDFAKAADERKNFTSSHPVILFSNWGYIPNGIGVVGTLKTKETFGKFATKHGLDRSPSVLTQILREATKEPATNLTANRFKSLKDKASERNPHFRRFAIP